MAGGKALFDDMLGSSMGVMDGNSFTAIDRTAFGEVKESNEFNFFTGKPEIEDLGYAFLFRNYQANTGKWQTSDPLGCPDGWNNLAYVNNGVTEAIDWLGGKVVVRAPSEEYYSLLNEMLDIINSTEQGKTIWDELVASPNQHEIIIHASASETGSGYVVPRNWENAENKVSTGSTVHVWPYEMTEQGWTSPAWAVLMHELVHAWRLETGTFISEPGNLLTPIEEELETSRITNQIISQWDPNYPLREHYGKHEIPE